MTPELHRPLALDRIGPDGADVTVEASPAECARLAERMQLPAVLSLSCRFHLVREGSTRVRAAGHLAARVVQTCAVTAEDFEAALTEDFRVRFVPTDEVSDDPELDDDDEVPYEGRILDLGEAAAEQLALSLDPYPRAPGAELWPIEDDEAPAPFTALSNLRNWH
jgi:uncharacterized metal-binding protein YceD (DUF177 family)